MAKKYKLELTLDEKQLSNFEMLQRAGDLETSKELVDNAITLLRWAVRQKQDGKAIVAAVLKDNETTVPVEIILPYLEVVASKSRKDAPPEAEAVKE